MSDVNKMAKLLDGIEVEWKSLGDDEFVEIANTGRRPVKSSLRLPGKTPYYGANNIQDYVEGYTHEGEFLLIAEDGSASLENYSIQYTTGKFWANNHVHVLRGKSVLNTRFLYHYLHIVNYIPYLTGGGRAKLTKAKMLEIKIPIPHPDIQAEIVRILDTFTELIAELSMRKKQYNYYRDQLLSFEEGEVEWKSLGEVFEFKNGINKGKEFFGKGDKIINFTDVFKKKKLFEDSINGRVITNQSDIKRYGCKKGDVFFTRTSETQDEIGYTSVLLSSIPVCVFSGFVIRARPITDLLLPEYCAYCFSSYEMRKKIIASSNMTTRVTTTGTALSKLEIPIPSLHEQQRIVSILDKFDTLTNSISEGLPKEIALRQQQYEYYREQLLNFPKPKA